MATAMLFKLSDDARYSVVLFMLYIYALTRLHMCPFNLLHFNNLRLNVNINYKINIKVLIDFQDINFIVLHSNIIQNR